MEYLIVVFITVMVVVVYGKVKKMFENVNRPNKGYREKRHSSLKVRKEKFA